MAKGKLLWYKYKRVEYGLFSDNSTSLAVYKTKFRTDTIIRAGKRTNRLAIASSLSSSRFRFLTNPPFAIGKEKEQR